MGLSPVEISNQDNISIQGSENASLYLRLFKIALSGWAVRCYRHNTQILLVRNCQSKTFRRVNARPTCIIEKTLGSNYDSRNQDLGDNDFPSLNNSIKIHYVVSMMILKN